MSQIFQEVHVFSEGAQASDQKDTRNTYVLVGTKQPWSAPEVVAEYDPAVGLSEMSDGEKEDLLRRSGTRPITDDWAPIENFLAPVVRMASREIAAGLLADRAEEALHEGRTKEAIATCERALRLYALDPNVRRVYASALTTQGNLAGAAQQYEELLRIRPGLIGARIQLASTLARMGRADEGIRVAREAILRDPSQAQAYFVLAILLEQVNRSDEAIAAYAEASRREPKNLDIRNNMGIALVRAGRRDEAQRVFEEILAMDPKFAKARKNLQHLLAEPQS
jgi:tetratricopeptide (TPR) repeat protein